VTVGVVVVGLNDMVIDLAYRELRLAARYAHRLELRVGHGACSVLSESLVDLECDLPTGF
jgi:spermidine synthase